MYLLPFASILSQVRFYVIFSISLIEVLDLIKYYITLVTAYKYRFLNVYILNIMPNKATI